MKQTKGPCPEQISTVYDILGEIINSSSESVQAKTESPVSEEVFLKLEKLEEHMADCPPCRRSSLNRVALNWKNGLPIKGEW